MAKISYTWFPKDWTNSESVFELDLEHRGLYRELIDLAMLQDNKVIINRSVWCRKWMVCDTTLSSMLNVLYKAQLIDLKEGGQLFIPSCESRLSLVRRGSKGGSTKPTVKPIAKQKKVKQNKTKQIKTPTLTEFLTYCVEEIATDRSEYLDKKQSASLKYKSWEVDDWHKTIQGKRTKINNWKNTILNTWKYL